LSVGGKDLRREPLEERRARVEALLAGADADLFRFSKAFDDAEKLLAAAHELGLEGTVSKKRGQVKFDR
jgi:bifunctional non-homologous end joining protein LigD